MLAELFVVVDHGDSLLICHLGGSLLDDSGFGEESEASSRRIVAHTHRCCPGSHSLDGTEISETVA